MSTKHYHGAVINPSERKREEPISYEVYPECCITVDADGNIQDIWPGPDCKEEATVTLGPDKFFLPGFIDTHTHAPQFPNLGIGQEYQLLEWLKQVTYPTEAKFSNIWFAECIYPLVVQRLVDCGTTTCCYYGTIHLDATKALVDIVCRIGQRALIGKCNMDREVPADNLEVTDQSVQDTEVLIKYIQDLKLPIIRPVITPRFAISCTPKLLSDLGKLAEKYDVHIQTHISENLEDIARMGELFPGSKSYADVYDGFKLLGTKTILAHAVHLGDDEVKLIAERGAGISHCPTSNFNLTSGIAPVGKYLDAGVKVGLGTDVSGGFNPSILSAIQHASIASKVIAMQHNPSDALKPGYNNRKLSVATLLYLATLGGAEVCGLEKDIGSFAPKKSFDALIVKGKIYPCPIPGGQNMSLDVVNRSHELRKMLEQFLFDGDDRNILEVYVQGRPIKSK